MAPPGPAVIPVAAPSDHQSSDVLEWVVATSATVGILLVGSGITVRVDASVLAHPLRRSGAPASKPTFRSGTGGSDDDDALDHPGRN